MIKVSFIIVNYNTFQLTCDCIASIIQHSDLSFVEIILVDNLSTECDPQLFKDKFPNITLIENNENGGFAKGNNVGIQKAKGEYVFLINSDAKLLNNAAAIGFEYFKSNPKTGVLSGKLTLPSGQVQKHTRKFRSISWELLEIFPFYLFLKKEKKENLMLHHYFDHTRPVSCDWVSGACMMIPKSIINKLPNGKLAEDFFMYCEDVLWCWQIKQLGFSVQYLPTMELFHLHHGSSSKAKQKKLRKTIQVNHSYFMKHYYYPNVKYYIFKLIYSLKQGLISLIAK